MFEDLNNENFILYAMKAYDRPNCLMSEFKEDMKRFNYYAPEDRDFCDRLRRRGGKFVQYPKVLVWDRPTSWKTKLRYLNKSGSHRKQLDKMHKIYEENCRGGVLVANEKSD